MWASVLQQVLALSELLGAATKLMVLQFYRGKRAVGPHTVPLPPPASGGESPDPAPL